MVVVDTNVIIDHLRQFLNNKNSVLIEFKKDNPGKKLAISVITVQELYEGRSTRDRLKEQQLLAVLSIFTVLPYDFETAQKAGALARDLANPIELADAAIAATALLNNAKLFTLNHKHFSAIKNLQLFSS